jgi:hypothetical protein
MSFEFHHLSDVGSNYRTADVGEDAEFISIQASTANFDDGILVVDKVERHVTWHSESGLRSIRRFHLSHAPIDAKFCEFQNDVPADDESSSESYPQSTLRTIAILLENNDLQIHLHSGELYEVQVPFVVRVMVPTKYGLMLQKNHHHSVDSDACSVDILQEVIGAVDNDFYILRHPLSSLTPVVFDDQR